MTAHQRHTSAERKRTHREAMHRIVHYCSCGMAPRGNAAWWSHSNAHPDHTQLTTTQWLEHQATRRLA